MCGLLLFEDRQKHLTSVYNAPVIDAHQPFEILDRELLKRAHHPDSGIIYEMCNPAMTSDNVVGKPLNLFQIGHVGEVC